MAILKALVDLTRAHFFFAWPILFCSGLFLAFQDHGGFDWMLLLKAALIGLCGMEAGLVLNDYVDRDLDRMDVDDTMTRYWRVFGSRPVSEGLISPRATFLVFLLLAGASAAITLTLPEPNRWYVLGIMLYCYAMEVFYQVKKRSQSYPVSQVFGRTDFALFPVAGYLVLGEPNMTIVYYILFFYPFALAHLAVNDLADIENDRARGMRTVPVLYGVGGTLNWITGFTLLNIVFGLLFILMEMNLLAVFGFAVVWIMLLTGLAMVRKEPSQKNAMRFLPMFHISLLAYSLTMIIQALL